MAFGKARPNRPSHCSVCKHPLVGSAVTAKSLNQRRRHCKNPQCGWCVDCVQEANRRGQ